MGLDSVELLYNFEQYFGLDVSDPVAAKLRTVGEAATYFSEQLGVATQRHSAARDLVQQQLGELLELSPSAFNEGGPTVQELLPNVEAVLRLRQQLADRYGTLIPSLSFKPLAQWVEPSLFEKLLGIQPRPPRGSWTAQPLATLVDWVVATNYEKLLPRPLASAYEVEQAIIGMTSDTSGVPVEEIDLNSAFVTDLGID